MQSNCNMIFTSCATFGSGNSEPDVVRSKAHPQGESERQSEGVLVHCSQGIQASCTLKKNKKMLSPGDGFGTQDETFIAV